MDLDSNVSDRLVITTNTHNLTELQTRIQQDSVVVLYIPLRIGAGFTYFQKEPSSLKSEKGVWKCIYYRLYLAIQKAGSLCNVNVYKITETT